MSIRTLFALGAALALATPVLAADQPAAPELDMEQSAAMRCAAAFALVANDQKRGQADAARFPPLEQRGKEYFVRVSARLMDDKGLDRAGVQALLKAEVDRLQNDSIKAADPRAFVDGVMRPCLVLLDLSGI